MASLYDCQRELRSIITEIENIEWGVRRDFTGIGQDLCADCLDRVLGKYYTVRTMLNNVDTNVLADFMQNKE